MGLAHAWGARFAIILGIINGGLGINLAGEDSKFWIPYTVIAVVVCAVWAGLAIRSEILARRKPTSRSLIDDIDTSSGPSEEEKEEAT